MKIVVRGVLAVLLTCAFARADGPADAAEGRRAFSAGVILLQDPDGAKYEEARLQFQKAYDLTRSWKVLGNLGLCMMKLERDGDAIAAYEKYLAGGEKEIDKAERAQIERDLSALRAQVAPTHLEIPGGAGTIIDERLDTRGNKVRNEYAISNGTIDLGLHPGRHTIIARVGEGEVRWETILQPAIRASHTFEMPTSVPANLAPRPAVAPGPAASGTSADTTAPVHDGHGTMVAGLVVGGFGVAGLAVGGIFGLQALSKKSERDEHCQPAGCDPTGLELDDAGRKAATVSTIGFAAGLVGVGVGSWLIISSQSGQRGARSARVAPVLGPSSACVQFEGTW